MYPKLNFPTYDFSIRNEENKPLIFDIIRKKNIVLTPEEWVRQHIVRMLIDEGYPKGLITVETGMQYNSMNKRTDIVVMDREGAPFLLVECKTFTQKINQKVVEQATIYNQTLKAKYMMVTNGMLNFCYAMDYLNNSYQQLETLPKFEA